MSDGSNEQPQPPSTREGGQLTVLMALVMVGLLIVALALGIAGQAMVDRWATVDAANAAALASVGEAGADELMRSFATRGLDVTIVAPGHAIARRGAAKAESWAEVDQAGPRVAPVMAAILARIAQLTGRPVEPVHLSGTQVELSPADAVALASLLGEFGWCRAGVAAFDRC